MVYNEIYIYIYSVLIKMFGFSLALYILLCIRTSFAMTRYGEPCFGNCKDEQSQNSCH